jgi:hypothetical protein
MRPSPIATARSSGLTAGSSLAAMPRLIAVELEPGGWLEPGWRKGESGGGGVSGRCGSYFLCFAWCYLSVTPVATVLIGTASRGESYQIFIRAPIFLK